MISAILVQHNGFELTRAAIRALRESQKGGVEIILIDNGSKGFDAAALRREFPELRVVLNPENEGFARANNLAASVATGEILLFLNTDTEAREPFAGLVEGRFREDPRLGVLGPRLVNPDGSFQLSAGELPTFFREIYDKIMYGMLRRGARAIHARLDRAYSARREVGWVTGAALFIRTAVFRRVGGFDEAMFMYFEDKDLCKRVRDAGARVVFDPSFAVMHIKAGSSTAALEPFLHRAYRASQRRYYARHRPVWERMLLGLYRRLPVSGGSPTSEGR